MMIIIYNYYQLLSSTIIHHFSLQLEDTIELCKMIESTGVAAIAIHGRTRPERPHHKNRTDYIAKITEVLKIPVIAK